MPEYLEEKIKVIENNPETEFIYSDFESFEGKGVDKTDFHKYFRRKYRKSDLSLDLLKQNWICTFSIVMLRKELIDGCDFQYSNSCTAGLVALGSNITKDKILLFRQKTDNVAYTFRQLY